VLILGLASGSGSNLVSAGDILRGGAGPSQAPREVRGQQATMAEQATARANAKDSLARTSRAIAAARALQSSAREAAQRNQARNLGLDPNHPGQQLPDVPDGLAVGGLEVAPGATPGSTLWSGAEGPVQSGAGSSRNVRIKQTQQTALLNWRTFNVGRNTTLTFDQSAGGSNSGRWIAFNKVNDPTGRPSQILGKINAEGQVYVINGNGIIFGGTSQVNTHTLVASSLPINDNLISRGLLNNPDAQFLMSGLNVPAGSNGTPAFNPAPSNLAGGRWGDVTVQAGAQLTSPANASNVGGRMALIGANVNNAGTISTPSGQTILAAGLQVGMAAHPTGDPSLRGLDVYVGAVAAPGLGAYAGSVVNGGIIDAPGGNAYLTGKSITHRGAILSSTSVALNGRVDIDASYDAASNTAYRPTLRPSDVPFLFQKTGSIELAAGSVIQILPEYRRYRDGGGHFPGVAFSSQSPWPHHPFWAGCGDSGAQWNGHGKCGNLGPGADDRIQYPIASCAAGTDLPRRRVLHQCGWDRRCPGPAQRLPAHRATPGRRAGWFSAAAGEYFQEQGRKRPEHHRRFAAKRGNQQAITGWGHRWRISPGIWRLSSATFPN